MYLAECRCGSTAEQLICNQQVIGSNPIIGFMGEFPSGQRGQTVNLLAVLSVVRIHLPPLAEIKKENLCETVIFPAFSAYDNFIIDAGWSSLEARRAHNPKVASSNLAPAILCVALWDTQKRICLGSSVGRAED